MDWQTILVLQKGIAFAAIALLLIAAYSDIRTFKIPNVLVLAIAALGIIRLILLGSPIAAFYAIAAVVLVFAIGFLLFSRGLVGAGDVKLLMATILLVRYPDIFRLFVWMSLFGALLSIAILVLRNSVPAFLGPRLGSYLAMIPRIVPYGVAIAFAGIVMILLQPMLLGYVVSLPSFL